MEKKIYKAGEMRMRILKRRTKIMAATMDYALSLLESDGLTPSICWIIASSLRDVADWFSESADEIDKMEEEDRKLRDREQN